MGKSFEFKLRRSTRLLFRVEDSVVPVQGPLGCYALLSGQLPTGRRRIVRRKGNQVHGSKDCNAAGIRLQVSSDYRRRNADA